jgi:hypothetical protein
MEELLRRLAALEAERNLLLARVAGLEKRASLEEIPEWAAVAVKKAVQQHLVDTPEGGSFDFYRFITIMDRLGMLDG